MSTDEAIRQLIREELASWAGSVPAEPELITVDEAAKICECAKSAIYDLVDQAPANGFPSVRLGTRTIRIDKRRLSNWIQAGGLAE